MSAICPLEIGRSRNAEIDPPRVLFLVRSLNQGGAERQLVALAAGLHRRGWPVTVACFYGGGIFQGELDKAGVPLIDLRKRGRWDVAAFIWRLWRAFRSTNANIVHGYLTMANVLALLAPVARPGTRVVWGVRESFIDRERRDWLTRLSFRLGCRLARLAKIIIVNSNAGAAHHVAAGYPESRMRVIPNGIDTERFRFDAEGRRRMRVAWGIPEDSLLVGLIGRIDPMKDHPTFLRMAALLAARDPRWRFVCVGRVPPDAPDYARAAKEQSASLGLHDRLVWTGPQDDMPAVYSALDILASTSCGEGFSNVVAEAMSCGRPCVVTDVGDSALIVGDAGLAVPAGNPEALCGAMIEIQRRLLADGPALMSRARTRVVEQFGMDTLIERTASALHALHRAARHESEATS